MFDAQTILKECGGQEDSRINLLAASLAMAAEDHPGISVDKYFNHASKMVRDVCARHAEFLAAGAKDDAGAQLAALKDIISVRENYSGDAEHFNDLQNADMMRVMDRRMGFPVALAIIFMHVAGENGWVLHGLNFPGHFLCRLDFGAERLIFDPANACALLSAHDLRDRVKHIKGKGAELSADYYKPCGNRETILRLQNNIKSRLIDDMDYVGALKNVEKMRVFAPDDYRLLLDAGVLYAKTGEKPKAVDVLEKYITLAPNPHDRREAEKFLRDLLVH